MPKYTTPFSRRRTRGTPSPSPVRAPGRALRTSSFSWLSIRLSVILRIPIDCDWSAIGSTHKDVMWQRCSTYFSGGELFSAPTAFGVLSVTDSELCNLAFMLVVVICSMVCSVLNGAPASSVVLTHSPGKYYFKLNHCCWTVCSRRHKYIQSCCLRKLSKPWEQCMRLDIDFCLFLFLFICVLFGLLQLT